MSRSVIIDVGRYTIAYARAYNINLCAYMICIESSFNVVKMELYILSMI